MTDSHFPPSDDSPDWVDELDRKILDGLKEIHEELDPMPQELDDVVLFALATRDLDGELARIVEDELVVASARATGRVRTIRFEMEDVELMVTVVEGATGRRRVDGWLAPAAPGTVEARTPRARPSSARTSVDEGGRFALTDLGSGPTQFVVRRAGGVIVTPVVQL
jgi:hypothetical protein